ncbi:hypothetical protein [Rhodopirellula europaea]|uniref:hypothetical protein n=1 Tax=Rhodopirellula europaea TaxID=1263866 RepID=UPI0011819F6E|nr:hypothetical protein [Rhodopirellula europaea]
MFSKFPMFALTLAALVSNATARSEVQHVSGLESVSISDAVDKFNKYNEESRAWADESPLTEHELIAALVHEKKTLSTETQLIADEIIEKRVFPTDVSLKVFGRRSADRHKTYVYFIELGFDKGPVNDEHGEIIPGRRRVEKLTVRKRYLATQKSSRIKKMKSLDELLAESAN